MCIIPFLAAPGGGGRLPPLFRWHVEGLGLSRAGYGSVAMTIALVMWGYYSAVVFAVGACLVRALEERAPAGATSLTGA